MHFYTQASKSIQLGNKIPGGKGGEGQVYHVVGQPQLLAKIYHDGMAEARREKIDSICAAGLYRYSRRNAFPIESLRDSQNRFRGFTMQRLSVGGEIHELYSARDRQAHFPNASTKFMVRTAANLARCVVELHSNSVVIGDINESGIFVDKKDALVHLVDCDSFQISVNGKIFPCMCMAPQYQPPEILQARMPGQLIRSPNHDAFGLAVMIFRLLMAGRHPFLGRWCGAGDPPSEIEMISAFRYAYGDTAPLLNVSPPLGSPPVRLLSVPLRLAFERAFGPNGVHARPLPSEWVGLIDGFEKELKRCALSPLHDYHRDLTECPWCTIEQNLSFSSKSAGKTSSQWKTKQSSHQGKSGYAYGSSTHSISPSTSIDHARIIKTVIQSSAIGGSIAVVPCALLWMIAPLACGNRCSEFAWMHYDGAGVFFGLTVFISLFFLAFYLLVLQVKKL